MKTARHADPRPMIILAVKDDYNVTTRLQIGCPEMAKEAAKFLLDKGFSVSVKTSPAPIRRLPAEERRAGELIQSIARSVNLWRNSAQ